MSKVIKFESGSIKEEDKKLKIKIGNTFQFEFIRDKLTPVRLINTNSKIDKYINEISTDHTIFVDFEFVQNDLGNQEDQSPPPICVFTFTCSKGIYVFKQTNLRPNQQLKTFLSAESGHEFIGFALRDSISRLKEMFGQDFTINLEDTLQSRLGPNKITAIRQIFEQFGDDMLIKFMTSSMKQKRWNNRYLSFEMFTFTATLCFLIYHCYEKFPQKVELSENDVYIEDEIEDENEVKKFEKKKKIKKKRQEKQPEDEWKIGEERKIEFFPNQFTTVILLNSDRDLKKFIPIISKSPVILLDFRFYLVDYERKKYISLFTFATSTNSYVFYKTTKEINERLRVFLSRENGLKFIGYVKEKVKKKLKKIYGDDFKININDVYSRVPRITRKNIEKTAKSSRSGCQKKNDDFYEIVTTFLDEPCERLQQFSDIQFNKYSSLALNVKKSAMWSVIVYKLYEKLSSKNTENMKSDEKKKVDEPNKEKKKEEKSKKETMNDDKFVKKKQKTYDNDDDDIIVSDDEKEDDDDNDVIVSDDENGDEDDIFVDDDELVDSDVVFDDSDDDFDENDEEDGDDLD